MSADDAVGRMRDEVADLNRVRPGGVTFKPWMDHNAMPCDGTSDPSRPQLGAITYKYIAAPSSAKKATDSMMDTSSVGKGAEAVAAEGEKAKSLFKDAASEARSAAGESDGDVKAGWTAIADAYDIMVKPVNEWTSMPSDPSRESKVDVAVEDANSKCGTRIPKGCPYGVRQAASGVAGWRVSVGRVQRPVCLAP